MPSAPRFPTLRSPGSNPDDMTTTMKRSGASITTVLVRLKWRLVINRFRTAAGLGTLAFALALTPVAALVAGLTAVAGPETLLVVGPMLDDENINRGHPPTRRNQP